MFQNHPKDSGKNYRIAVFSLLVISAAALVTTIWVELDFLRDQEILDEITEQLPRDSRSSAEELSGELRWQFRLITLVGLNLVVTGIAIALLWRAYRASQDTLRDFKALAGDILSSMDQAVITTDLEGHVTSINRRGLEFLKQQPTCVGLPLANLSNAVPLEEFRHEWLVEKSNARTRDHVATINGSDRVLRMFCQTLSDVENNEIGFVLQLRDVTKRFLIEDRMRRMERYMGLGSLAVGLHHEIKNPLAALSLHVQLLEEQLEGGDASTEISQMLNVIKTEVTRIGGVLENFRDFASIGHLNVTSVNLVNLIKSKVELISPQASQQGIQIKLQLEQDFEEIKADRGRLEQVLLNLLLNAMEAMPQGGVLEVSCTSNEGMVIVEVTDNGHGIPPDLRDKILDPYFTTKSQGTGLGLALCDKIMREHNGSLEFRSLEQGTTFQMALPLTQFEAVSTE